MLLCAVLCVQHMACGTAHHAAWMAKQHSTSFTHNRVCVCLVICNSLTYSETILWGGGQEGDGRGGEGGGGEEGRGGEGEEGRGGGGKGRGRRGGGGVGRRGKGRRGGGGGIQVYVHVHTMYIIMGGLVGRFKKSTTRYKYTHHSSFTIDERQPRLV